MKRLPYFTSATPQLATRWRQSLTNQKLAPQFELEASSNLSIKHTLSPGATLSWKCAILQRSLLCYIVTGGLCGHSLQWFVKSLNEWPVLPCVIRGGDREPPVLLGQWRKKSHCPLKIIPQHQCRPTSAALLIVIPSGDSRCRAAMGESGAIPHITMNGPQPG